jgi:hypothetical protein
MGQCWSAFENSLEAAMQMGLYHRVVIRWSDIRISVEREAPRSPEYDWFATSVIVCGNDLVALRRAILDDLRDVQDPPLDPSTRLPRVLVPDLTELLPRDLAGMVSDYLYGPLLGRKRIRYIYISQRKSLQDYYGMGAVQYTVVYFT